MSITIRQVSSKSDLNRFIRFPWKIYKGNPNWVPPLIIDMKTRLSPKKNPYFAHSRAKYFLAYRNSEIVGRIAATVNVNYNKFHNENIGFFGFFESIDDQAVADSLFEAAANYLREEKADAMRGPANFSSNDDWGLLFDGFDKPPVVLMPYNPRYYIGLLEGYGFIKAMDLYAYWMDKHEMTNRLIRTAELLKKRSKILFRKIDIARFREEVELVRQIYNAAWEKNWGFVPMTEREFDHIAKDMKLILDPELVIIAEDKGKPVGFSLGLPNINQALIHLNGRLFPTGLFKLLHYKKKIHQVRVLTMGVIPEYRNRGIDAVFYYETFKNGTAKGYDSGEFSWVLENNEAMNKAASNMGAKLYKTYRIYEYNLTKDI